jgi:hypothetical protein
LPGVLFIRKEENAAARSDLAALPFPGSANLYSAELSPAFPKKGVGREKTKQPFWYSSVEVEDESTLYYRSLRRYPPETEIGRAALTLSVMER